MKSEVLTNSGLSILPTVAMVLFVLVFIGVVIWTFKKSNNEVFKASEQIPLDDSNLENQENNNE